MDQEVVEQEHALVVVAEQLVKEIMEEQEQDHQHLVAAVAVGPVLQEELVVRQVVAVPVELDQILVPHFQQHLIVGFTLGAVVELQVVQLGLQEQVELEAVEEVETDQELRLLELQILAAVAAVETILLTVQLVDQE